MDPSAALAFEKGAVDGSLDPYRAQMGYCTVVFVGTALDACSFDSRGARPVLCRCVKCFRGYGLTYPNEGGQLS